MKIEKVAVIGAGTMGASICVALAASGYEVWLFDTVADALERGLERIDRFFASLVRKGLDEKEAQRRKSLIRTVVDYKDFNQIDLVVEAVTEHLEVKKNVFQSLEAHCRRETILATNTSSLSITEVAAAVSHPDRVIGMHFFNPAHLMKLVEIIPALQTSDKVTDAALEFARSLGKLAVRVEECASFLVNRLLGRYMNESLWCLGDGLAGIEEIDRAACDFAMPIGPLALRDMNGADIGLAVTNFNFQEYGERFKPAPLLGEMVERGWLGQKTGKGFYLYDPETRKRTGPNPELENLLPERSASSRFFVERLFLPMINEAFIALQERVVRAEDLDPAMVAGLGMRRGPLEIAENLGLGRCLELLEELFTVEGERFRPAPLLKKYVRAGWSSMRIPSAASQSLATCQ